MTKKEIKKMEEWNINIASEVKNNSNLIFLVNTCCESNGLKVYCDMKTNVKNIMLCDLIGENIKDLILDTYAKYHENEGLLNALISLQTNL